MLAQRLRFRITIQEQVEELSTSGEPLGFVWQNWATDVPAEILSGPGREFHAANAKQAETAARITIRWVQGLNSKMRILTDFDGADHVFDITSLETDRTGRMEWRLTCAAGVNNGA
jgi:head-tail adaptor